MFVLKMMAEFELKQVQPGDKEAYIEARKQLAELELSCCRPKEFVRHHKELVDRYPDDLKLRYELAEAWLKTLDLDNAIDIYKTAYSKFQDKREDIAIKCGRLLAQFGRLKQAVEWFQKCCKDMPANMKLTFELAICLEKVGSASEAESVLASIQFPSSGMGETEVFVEARLKLVDLLKPNPDKVDDCISLLDEAVRVLNDSGKKRVLILNSMAELYTLKGDSGKSEALYSQARELDPTDAKSLFELGKIAIRAKNLASARSYLLELIKHSPNHVDGMNLLVDIFTKQHDFVTATNTLLKFLGSNPTEWNIFAVYFDVSRRAGKWDPSFIERLFCSAETKLSASTNKNATSLEDLKNVRQQPGFLFCLGLFQYYRGDWNAALEAFNSARHDLQYAFLSSCKMVEIYTSLGEGSLGEDMSTLSGGAVAKTSVEAATLVIRELKTNAQDPYVDVLRARVLMATKIRSEIDYAIETLDKLLSSNPGFPPALAELATAHLIQGNTQKAQTCLKRLKEMEWKYEYADDFERGFLLMTDLYGRASKFDKARMAALRCIAYNQYCSRAYEYIGYIAEKEGKFEEAVQAYEKVWKTAQRCSPSTGYRYASCCMRVRQFMSAMDVAKEVACNFPEYSRIRNEVLDKVHLNFRILMASID